MKWKCQLHLRLSFVYVRTVFIDIVAPQTRGFGSTWFRCEVQSSIFFFIIYIVQKIPVVIMMNLLTYSVNVTIQGNWNGILYKMGILCMKFMTVCLTGWLVDCFGGEFYCIFIFNFFRVIEFMRLVEVRWKKMNWSLRTILKLWLIFFKELIGSNWICEEKRKFLETRRIL